MKYFKLKSKHRTFNCDVYDFDPSKIFEHQIPVESETIAILLSKNEHNNCYQLIYATTKPIIPNNYFYGHPVDVDND